MKLSKILCSHTYVLGMNCGSSFVKHHMYEFHSRVCVCVSLPNTSVKCLFFLLLSLPLSFAQKTAFFSVVLSNL